MDWTTIAVALLAFLGTLGGSWLGVRESNKLVVFRINELEKKVDKHNHLVERMAVVERDLKTAYNRIDDTNRRVDKVEGKIDE